MASPLSGRRFENASGLPLILQPCGPESISFDVKTAKSQPGPAQADPAKALVYFIQDDGRWGNHQLATLRIGLDGKWAGTYKHNSYLSVSVEPGEHHVCVNVQQPFPINLGSSLSPHFTAEQGRVYYFRTRLLEGLSTLYPTPPQLDLGRPDSDQAKLLDRVLSSQRIATQEVN